MACVRSLVGLKGGVSIQATRRQRSHGENHWPPVSRQGRHAAIRQGHLSAGNQSQKFELLTAVAVSFVPELRGGAIDGATLFPAGPVAGRSGGGSRVAVRSAGTTCTGPNEFLIPAAGGKRESGRGPRTASATLPCNWGKAPPLPAGAVASSCGTTSSSPQIVFTR